MVERKGTASVGIKAWLLSRPRFAWVFMLGFSSRESRACITVSRPQFSRKNFLFNSGKCFYCMIPRLILYDHIIFHQRTRAQRSDLA